MMDSAVMEFDEILRQSNFAIDYEITESNFNSTVKPIAYRNISRIDAATKPLYLVWNVITPIVNAADDKTNDMDIDIALAFYANNPWIYNQTSPSTDTAAFKLLLQKLEERGWTIEPGSEYPEIANEGSAVYAHRKDYIITKNFIRR